MSDIDLAVSRSKRLESLLEQSLGATGRGLHEKVSSVENRLPPDLVRKLRLVATVRNKVVHEADYKNIDDRKKFLQTCKEAERQLRALTGAGRNPAKMIAVAGLILVIIVTAVVYKVMHR